jgi:hypothetical protein
MCTGGGKLLSHQFVNSIHERLWKIAAANARLICDDDNGQPGLIEAADGSRDKGKHTKSAGMIQVAHFFGDGAIAVEKDGGTPAGRFRQDAPRKARVAPKIPP